MVSDTDTSLCSLCGLAKEPHLRAEANGEIHHRFASEEGQLVESPQVKKHQPPTAYVGAREDQILLKLIAVLTEKGILTGEDLARVMGGTIARTTPERDHGRRTRQARPTPRSE